MKKKYTDFICEKIRVVPEGIPIYTRQLAEKIAVAYQLSKREASAATAVAVKRVMDKGVMPELRCYQKGVYYRTAATPFGCNQRAQTDGFAEQNGRDAERADLTCRY